MVCSAKVGARGKQKLILLVHLLHKSSLLCKQEHQLDKANAVVAYQLVSGTLARAYLLFIRVLVVNCHVGDALVRFRYVDNALQFNEKRSTQPLVASICAQVNCGLAKEKLHSQG